MPPLAFALACLALVACGTPCATSCDSCPEGERCIRPFDPRGIDTFGAFCSRTCQSDGDCATGSRCVLVVVRANTPPLAVCVDDTQPVLCSTYDKGPFMCNAAQECVGGVLLTPVVDAARHFCSFEIQRCPNGCSGGTPGSVGPCL
jgi:hypothetical protein